MSNDILDMAKAALEGITAGPWVFQDEGDNLTVGAGEYLKTPGCYRSTDLILETDVCSYERDEPDYQQCVADAKFIAAAPELVRGLAAEVERLRAAG